MTELPGSPRSSDSEERSSGRRLAIRDGDVAPAAPEQSPSRAGAVGNWPCVCGHEYRVLTEPLTFWPRNSANGYRAEAVRFCVTCGLDLEERFALEAAHLASLSIL